MFMGETIFIDDPQCRGLGWKEQGLFCCPILCSSCLYKRICFRTKHFQILTLMHLLMRLMGNTVFSQIGNSKIDTDDF